MISKLNKILLFTILFIFTMILSLGLLLLNGLKIQSFQFNNISVNGLYIKIDKKLIVSVDQIHLPQTEDNTGSLDDLHYYIERLPYLQEYVKSIDLRQLYIGDKTFIIEYDQDNIYIDTDQFNLSVQPNYKNNILNLQLYSLYLKEQNILLEGNINYDLVKNHSLFNGNFYYKQLHGTLASIIDSDFINFHVDSSTLQDIKFIKDFVRLEPEIEQWMYDNVKGKFKFNFLNGKVAINEKGLELIELNGDANVTNATVKYHQKLEPVHTPLLNIQYKNDNLYFKMQKPVYKGIKLYGSEVTIYSLTGDKPYIDIDLVTKHKLSREIIEIVEAYGGSIPITQVNGATDSKLKISVKLHGDYDVNLYGEFKAKNSDFRISDFKFFAYDANVVLDNDLLLIKNSLVEYDKNLKMYLDLNIDLQKNIADGKARNISYKIANEEYSFIDINGLDTKVNVDFNNDLYIDIDSLDLQLVSKDDYLEVRGKNLNKLYHYSQFLNDLGIRWGNGSLNIYSKEKLDFKAQIKNLDLPLYKSGSKITSLNILGSVNEKRFNFSTIDSSLQYTNKNNRLNLNGIDIQYEENKNKKKNYEQLTIIGKDSNILLNNGRKILAKNYELRFKDNYVSLLKAKYKNTVLNFQGLNKERNLVDIKNISPEFFEAFTNKEFVYGGTSNLHAESKNGQYNGVLYLKDVLIKTEEEKKETSSDKKPQNISEYLIKNGKLLFLYDDKSENLNFYEVKTQGNGLDLDGQININLNTKVVQGEFEASFFKMASTVIGSIPLVNYLILGDDQKISLTAKVTGTLDDMKISTNAAASTVKAPFSIFGRALLLPFKTIEKVVNPKEE